MHYVFYKIAYQNPAALLKIDVTGMFFFNDFDRKWNQVLKSLL